MLIILIASILAFIIGIKPLCVMTGSMEPNLPTGSLIFVDTNAAYDELALKDVIVYKNEAKDFTIVHRVINITEEGIRKDMAYTMSSFLILEQADLLQ